MSTRPTPADRDTLSPSGGEGQGEGATRQIATGYTFGNSPKGRHGFANGAVLVRQYIEQVRQLEAEGHIVASVADMLVDDATTLVAALNAL